GTVEELRLLPVRRMAALWQDDDFIVRQMACDHPHDRRRSEHVRSARHEKGRSFDSLELLWRHEMDFLLPSPSAGFRLLIKLRPLRYTFRIDGPIGRPELAKPTRQFIPLI